MVSTFWNPDEMWKSGKPEGAWSPTKGAQQNYPIEDRSLLCGVHAGEYKADSPWVQLTSDPDWYSMAFQLASVSSWVFQGQHLLTKVRDGPTAWCGVHSNSLRVCGQTCLIPGVECESFGGVVHICPPILWRARMTCLRSFMAKDFPNIKSGVSLGVTQMTTRLVLSPVSPVFARAAAKLRVDGAKCLGGIPFT